MTRQFVLLLLFSAFTFAQAGTSNRTLKAGSSVYLEPTEGFEAYLTAAMTKKKVPLVVVADKEKADFVISSKVMQRPPAEPALYPQKVWEKDHGETSASISLIDPRSSEVLFAYTARNTDAGGQLQFVAENCAKHLKEFIEKHNK